MDTTSHDSFQKLTDALEASDARVRELEAALCAAEAANRAKDHFLARLGHELRNPIAPILTALQWMQMRGESALTREREIIGRQVRHLTRLVDDLLDVARVTQGKLALDVRRTTLNAAIAHAVELATPLVDAHLHRLVVDVPREPLEVDGDPERLAQVFANLIANAAKYTRLSGHIAVRAARDGPDIVVRVEDDGDGIPAELLERVFDPFAQGSQSADRRRGGMGLGLPIARTIVELHGGTLTASSEGEGRGSTFIVRISAAEDDETQAATVVDMRVGEALGAEHKPARRVLLVDDNEDGAQMMAEVLTALGHSVEVAYDASHALALLARFTPEVAVLDLGLPIMDGYELLRRLRARPELASVRYIASTGYGAPSDRARAFDAGFHEHLTKPVDLDRLARAVAGASDLEPPRSSSRTPASAARRS